MKTPIPEFDSVIIKNGDEWVIPTVIRYPDGGITVRITERLEPLVTVYSRLRTPEDFMILWFVKEVTERVSPFTKMNLTLLYASASRQDRMCAYGDSIGKVIIEPLKRWFTPGFGELELFSHSDPWCPIATRKLLDAYLKANVLGHTYLPTIREHDLW